MKSCRLLWREARWKSEGTKHFIHFRVGALLEVAMPKKCTRCGAKHMSKSKCTWKGGRDDLLMFTWIYGAGFNSPYSGWPVYTLHRKQLMDVGQDIEGILGHVVLCFSFPTEDLIRHWSFFHGCYSNRITCTYIEIPCLYMGTGSDGAALWYIRVRIESLWISEYVYYTNVYMYV